MLNYLDSGHLVNLLYLQEFHILLSRKDKLMHGSRTSHHIHQLSTFSSFLSPFLNKTIMFYPFISKNQLILIKITAKSIIFIVREGAFLIGIFFIFESLLTSSFSGKAIAYLFSLEVPDFYPLRSY